MENPSYKMKISSLGGGKIWLIMNLPNKLANFFLGLDMVSKAHIWRCC
jgi:hypothetical protein